MYLLTFGILSKKLIKISLKFMTENFNILVNKLNSFKRKLYVFKLLKFLLLTLLFGISVFTVFSVV